MGKTDDHIHQQLSRSLSFDSPMDLKGMQSNLPKFEEITTPKMRYSLNRQRFHNDKTNRFSLDQNQVSLQNRQVCKSISLLSSTYINH